MSFLQIDSLISGCESRPRQWVDSMFLPFGCLIRAVFASLLAMRAVSPCGARSANNSQFQYFFFFFPRW